MKKSTELIAVEEKIEGINLEIQDLQVCKSELRETMFDLKMRDNNLIPGETRIICKGVIGVFSEFYKKYPSSNWIRVFPINKNGKVLKRKITFYSDWKKV